MGLAIEREHFEPEDYERFSQRLQDGLVALREVLARPGFGVGAASLGAELELCLVGRERPRPLPANLRVLSESDDPRLTVELDRFNLEANLRHAALAGRPFHALERELQSALQEVGRAAGRHGGRPVAIGILPTLRAYDLQSGSMTDTPRFRALSLALQRRRRGPFHLRIDGEEPLDVPCDDITFEGAATSLQLHLRVDPGEFAPLYNAVQIATPVALAAAGNSPLFLGHLLWEETRVALFKQAVDDRGEAARRARRNPRVSFGAGWVREGALELFADAVACHDPLIPVCGDEEPLACLRAGGLPRLDEMRLHQGTVWTWNRPIYDPALGGHLRIEMRALPSGPSVPDMLANAAFLVGLAHGLRPEVERWVGALPFERVHHGFYRAAQRGLAAELAWPGRDGGLVERPAARLVEELLPVAEAGLAAAGVDASDGAARLELLAQRCRREQTGATWQRRALAALERRRSRPEAVEAMLGHYLAASDAGVPVHAWELPA